LPIAEPGEGLIARASRRLRSRTPRLLTLPARIQARIRRATTPAIVYNVNAAHRQTHPKRALVVNRIMSFLLKEDDPEFLRHQSLRRCKYIAAVLGELGYVVDVASGSEITRGRITRFRAAAEYDLIISDRADMEGTDRFFRSDAVRIFLARTMNHLVGNANLRRRYQRLLDRRRCEIQTRGLEPETMPYVMTSDAIIVVGNEPTSRTWRELYEGPVYALNNAGFRGIEARLDGKDFERARKHFLFFASGPQVRKGLDLLLETFPKHPDLHLYVCGRYASEQDFCTCYHKELYDTPNVHPMGWVEVKSAEFYDLARRCAYVVHPACIEGQAGSVVQCMHSGLIPLVTREVGLDTEDFGLTFADDSLEEIERALVRVSRLPADWHRERSLRTRAVAEEKYGEDALVNRWRELLTAIAHTGRTLDRRLA
jgi:glycosyltransferase involved in cell wall biosynthesis